MRKLLNSRSLRHLNLLEILYCNEWMTTKAISEEVGLSERLIRSDIAYLNRGLEFFEIQYAKKYGYCLTLFDNYSKSAIYKYILKDSLEFNFLEILAFGTGFSASTICKHLYISQSTLGRLVNRLNQKLKSSKMEITSHPYRITGDESLIRQFLIHLMLEKYQKATAVFSDDSLNLVNDMIVMLEEQDEPKIEYTDKYIMQVCLLVSVTRTKNNHKIPINNDVSNVFYQNIISDKNSLKKIEKIFCKPITIPLLQQIFDVFLLESYLKSNVEYESSVFFIKRQDHYRHLLNKLSVALDFEISNAEHVLNCLLNEESRKYQSNCLLYNKRKDFIMNSHTNFSAFYNLFVREYRKIFKDLSYSDNIMFNRCYCVLVNWDKLLERLEKKKDITICLHFNVAERHQYFLAQYVKQALEMDCNLTIINEISVETLEQNAANYSLVLTNKEGLTLGSTPVIACSLFPDQKKRQLIKKRIKQL